MQNTMVGGGVWLLEKKWKTPGIKLNQCSVYFVAYTSYFEGDHLNNLGNYISFVNK